MKAVIELKSKRYKPFVAMVRDFAVTTDDEPETEVTFARCEETVFPSEDPDAPEGEYTTMIKNIKSVNPYKPES